MKNVYVKFSLALVGGTLLLQLGGCVAVPALMVGGTAMGTMVATDRRTPGSVIEYVPVPSKDSRYWESGKLEMANRDSDEDLVELANKGAW